VTDTTWVTLTVTVVLVGAFGANVERWTRHTSPALGARLLIGLSSVAAAAVLMTLVMVALPLVGQIDALADYAHWSDAVFARESSTGATAGILAACALGAALWRAARVLRRQMAATAGARKLCSELGAAPGETVVVAADEADAMALCTGIVVITRGLARALDPGERRAVLAHEHAHLRHGHHRYMQAALLLAASNPMLRRVPGAVSYLTERWADEEAARATSRATVATALERIARLSALPPAVSPVTLRAAAVAVAERVLALRGTPPRLLWSRLLSPVLLVVSLLVVMLLAVERTWDAFQLATAIRDVASGGR
jgi:Zn-dependent protease with chaperone function